MPKVQSGPAIGLMVQIVLLAVLDQIVGLSAASWLVGAAYAAGTCLMLTRGLRRSGATRLGPADRVTLTRAILVGGVTALTVDSVTRPAPVGLLVALTAVALALDAVDGYVARRTGTASPLGARFDMEIDAFLLLVLSVLVAPWAGGWVVAIGAMRYAFVAAGWLLPWLRAPLPPRYWRKVVAATQGVVLAVAVSDLLPRPITISALVVALAMLVESFGHDVAWLWRHRPTRTAVPAPAGGPTETALPEAAPQLAAPLSV